MRIEGDAGGARIAERRSKSRWLVSCTGGAAMRSRSIPWRTILVSTVTLAAGFAQVAGCTSDDGGSGGDGGSDDATTPADGDSEDRAVPGADASSQRDGRADGDASDGGPSDASSEAADAGDAADASDAADADAGHDAGPTTDLYDPTIVPKLELTFDAAAMAVLSSTLEADQKKWVHGTFTYGAIVIPDVGVRRKGSSTFRALPQKAAFKIRFDKYVAGQTLQGLTDLTLNNSVSDPTFLAERLTYHVFRSTGLPAQKCNSAEVTINGDPYGLYVNVETPNAQLISRLFGANAKTLYEVNYGSQWMPGSEDGFEEDVGDGTKADVTALFGAVQAANDATLLADVAARLDTTEWLHFSAAEATVGHYDGYGFGIWGSHNYFMAGNQGGAFSLIPWSTDLTLSDREGVVDANAPKNTAGGQSILLVRCKQTASCWNAYKDAVKDVLATYEGLDLVTLAQTWHAQVHPYVLADPKREATLGYYNSETTLLYGWLAARPGVVRAQLGIAP